MKMTHRTRTLFTGICSAFDMASNPTTPIHHCRSRKECQPWRMVGFVDEAGLRQRRVTRVSHANVVSSYNSFVVVV